VRYVEDTTINEDMLSCKPIKRRSTTKKKTLQIVDDFMKEKIIKWRETIGVCTDGARVMAGNIEGLRP
jgi:hypothetical protein